jgi:hypothetical protein
MTLRPGSSNEYIYETLGEIKASFKGVSQQIDMLAAAVARTGADLSSELQDLRDDVSEMVRRVDKLEVDYIAVRSGLDGITPKVESLIEQRIRWTSWAMGATGVVGFLAWMFSTYVVSAIKAILPAAKP